MQLVTLDPDAVPGDAASLPTRANPNALPSRHQAIEARTATPTSGLAGRFMRNSVLSAFNSLSSLVSGLILLPLTLHHFGMQLFGVLALVTAISGYAAMLDLGMNMTITKRVAECRAKRDAGSDGISTVASTMMVVYVGVGLFAGISIGWLALPYVNVFGLAARELYTFHAAIAILAIQTAISFPLSVGNSVLCGLQDYAIIYVGSTIASFVRLASSIILLDLGMDLVGFVALGAGIGVGLLIVNYALAHHRIDNLRVRARLFRADDLHQLSRFSGSMFVWTAAGYSLHRGDRVLLGAMTTPSTVGIYDIGARLALYSRSVIQGCLDMLVPHAADQTAKGEGDLRRVYVRLSRIVMLSYGAVVATLLAAGGRLMQWWLGPGHTLSFDILVILVVANLFQAQTIVGHPLLVGMSRMRAFTLAMAAYPVVMATASLPLVQYFGAEGMAIGVLTAVVIVETSFLFILKRELQVSLKAMFRTCQLPAVGSICVAWSLGRWVGSDMGGPGLLPALVSGIATILIYATSALLLGTSVREKRRVLQIIGARYGSRC